MKKLLSILLLLGFATVKAQTTEEKGDTTRITLKNKIIEIIQDSLTGRNKVSIIPIDPISKKPIGDPVDGTNGEGDEEENEEKNFEIHPIGVDLGISLFPIQNSLNYPSEYSGLETKPLNSMHVGLHLLPIRIGIVKSKVNICTALDIDHLQMAFSQNTVLMPGMDTLSWFNDSSSVLRKSKLNATYLQVPLMLRFDTNPNEKKKSFRFAIGGYYGILINSFNKIKTESGDKNSVKDDFSLNKVRYGVTGRIGFRGLEFYCNYNLSNLFQENKGPEMASVSFGVGIGGPW